MEKTIIRPAGPEDYEAVERIMKQVQKMHVEWRPDIYRYVETALPCEAFAEAVKQGTFLAAERNGKVVGILSYLIRHVESENHVTRDVIFIDSMAVEEDCRGQGIGRQLFDAVRKIREQRGLDGIELQVNAKNTAAKKMYESYGFTEKSINMELLP